MKGVIYTNLISDDFTGLIKYCEVCGHYCLVSKDNENKCPCSCHDSLVWAGEKDNRIYFTDCTINDLHRLGYLVLKLNTKIEYEDNETGILHELEIYDFDGDALDCVEYGLDGEVCSEWQIPLSVYVSQLESIGALDAYPMVDRLA